MAYVSISLAANGKFSVSNGTSKAPLGANLVQFHLEHQYDFGSQVSVKVSCDNTGMSSWYQTALAERLTNGGELTTAQSTFIGHMAEIKGLVFGLEFYDRTDGQVLVRLRGRLNEGGGVETLEETWGDNPDYISSHLDYQGMLQSLFSRVETQFVAKTTGASPSAETTVTALSTMLGLMNDRPMVLNVPLYNHSGTLDLNGTAWQQKLREVAANYIGVIGADDIRHINALVKANKRTGGHLLIDVGEKKSSTDVAALATTLSYDDHQIRIMWNPTKSRPSDGSSIRKSWRPCVGDYIAKHILRNQMRDANGIPPLHVPVGGYDFPVNFLGVQYLDNFILSDDDQESLAEAGVIVVINERFGRESRWIYGDILTQRNSRTSALRLANAAEVETFTARRIIEIAKRYLLSNMNDYRNKAMSDGARFLDNCVAAGLLEPSEQLNGLYYSLDIAPRQDKPFEAVDIKLARRAVGAVRQAYLETTINK